MIFPSLYNSFIMSPKCVYIDFYINSRLSVKFFLTILIKENKELCQFEFTLHKLLGLYIKAKSEFDARVKKYNDNKFPKFGHTETVFEDPMNSSETTKEEK